MLQSFVKMLGAIKLHLLSTRRECLLLLRKTGKPLTLLFALFLLGCPVVLPLGGDEVGRRITENQLDFVRPGITSKSEVITQLGEPDVIWETERIFTYNWDVIRSKYVVGVVAPGAASPPFVTTESRTHCVLLFRFDAEDRVERFQLTRRLSSVSYGEHLRKWVGQSGKQAEPESLGECGE